MKSRNWKARVGIAAAAGAVVLSPAAAFAAPSGTSSASGTTSQSRAQLGRPLATGITGCHTGLLGGLFNSGANNIFANNPGAATPGIGSVEGSFGAGTSANANSTTPGTSTTPGNFTGTTFGTDTASSSSVQTSGNVIQDLLRSLGPVQDSSCTSNGANTGANLNNGTSATGTTAAGTSSSANGGGGILGLQLGR